MARDGSVVPADPQALVKKKTQSSRSWIAFDGTGQGSLLDVDKYAIMHRVQINARDLRILDPLLSYPSTILGREKAIVLNLEHIKAIITADEVLLRDPTDEHVVPVVEELQRRLPKLSDIHQLQGDGKEYLGGQHDNEAAEEDESPFEFRALEVALEAICSFLAARTTELEMAAYPALDELTSKISSRNLDRVRKLKSAMTRLTARVQKVRDELEQLLDDDDDMADLYLSRKAGSASPVSGSGANWFAASPTVGSRISRASRASIVTVRLDENDVEELEMLLEAYFMQIDGTLNKLTTLREYIDDTEDYINIQLDNHRNQLIQLELFLSSGTVCLAFYSLVAGIFGMNIPYTWNDDHGYMFKWVVIFSGVFSAIMFLMIIIYARKKGLVGS
ncbi:putative Mg2+ transporter protein, CorA-like/Zinc transport protein ZntB [Medicago truncatula]|uniref:Magnesium transporter n=1 Tax=Medicago truncatula TaxID=3880 RepID=G7I479_MEDTR|nr:magnesium transporter MRS2-I [Medicago truncatula]AES62060.1 magnesium transporter MRS2-like protein [Medicago truncatula]KEH42773.1 magnesium transporter MRS2-like protein [Medicago truncatula]RHN80401.1 putative Mg2+ transporter protein, CorA-like/Zinc transport protein ZntB [Medicago truncatula]